MRRPRRRRLLALLLLLTVATLGTSAFTPMRDSSDPLDLVWRDGYYMSGNGFYCQKCPAGTYIAEECKEQNGSGRCESCRHGEYMEYPNALRWCQECLQCREDQVQQSPCQPLRNTVCACKDGTFCPPDHPCEMCQKCQPRCPVGQVELKPCTPDSDLQCGPATDTGSSYLSTILPVIAVGIAVILLAVICFSKHYCSSPGDGRPSSRRPYEMVSSMFRKLLWCRTVNVGAEDNATNGHLESQQRHTEPETRVPMLPSESGKPKRSLVPAPGNDPVSVLRRSFYTFARKVPKDDWKKFGRSLDLEENDVVTATTDDGFYEMLNKWLSREGSKASVNTLLETLDWLHLGGVAEEISCILVQKGLFQDEMS